jgi:hypothetical protein
MKLKLEPGPYPNPNRVRSLARDQTTFSSFIVVIAIVATLTTLDLTKAPPVWICTLPLRNGQRLEKRALENSVSRGNSP